MVNSIVNLRPSSAGRWVPCPGSASLEAQFPDVEDDSTREGTAVHWAGENILTTGEFKIGDTAPNGVIITDEMIEFAEEYALWVAKEFDGFDIHIEEYVEIPAIYDGYGGTPDLWGWNQFTRVLKISDLKYGWGIVEPELNRQLLDYAAGIVRKFNLDPASIEIIIYQPRPPHEDGRIRKWVFNLATLWECEKLSFDTAAEARGPNPRIVSGSHCRDCKAICSCPAALKSVLSAITVTETARLDNPSNEEIAKRLELFEMAEKITKAMFKGIVTLAESKIQSGERILGWAMRNSYGRDKFTKPAKHMKGIAAMYGVDISKDAVMTPLQSIKAGLPEFVVDANKTTPNNGFKLKRFDTAKKAKELFK